MISESLNYLRNGEDWVKTVLIGGVLGLLSVLIVPTFLVIGYLLRVVRATMKGDEEPPVFDDWGEMAIDGVKGFAIAFVYALGQMPEGSPDDGPSGPSNPYPAFTYPATTYTPQPEPSASPAPEE